METIWECEWNKPPIPTKACDPATENDIINGIMQNEIFGIVKCDMKVPEHLETFSQNFHRFLKILKLNSNRKLLASICMNTLIQLVEKKV